MNKLSLIFCLLLLPLISQAQTDEKNVSRILETLSSDEMRGRQAFSPEIKKAANFISGEFEAIGLSPIQGNNSFLQTFNLNSISIDEADVSLDQRSIANEHYFATINAEDISWSDRSGVTVKQISAEDDFQRKFGEFNNLKEDLIIFVDSAHSSLFSRYQSFFSRPSRSFSLETGFNKVFILGKETDTFTIELTKSVRKPELANVVGMIEGKQTNEIVVFSAHYDHIGVTQAVEGDSIANGANDNASGTTAVIELARHFAQEEQPERTLMFVGFTAEEVGGFGSQYFSGQVNPDQIVAMFNIEMIGKPATDGPNSAWITGFEKSSFGKLLQKSTEGTKYTFYPDPYPDQNLFYRSDNATLARLGVPAHTISTTPIDVDQDYHRVSDELSTLNIAHLTNTIDAIARAAKGIVTGEHTPTRVDKESVN